MGEKLLDELVVRVEVEVDPTTPCLGKHESFTSESFRPPTGHTLHYFSPCCVVVVELV